MPKKRAKAKTASKKGAKKGRAAGRTMAAGKRLKAGKGAGSKTAKKAGAGSSAREPSTRAPAKKKLFYWENTVPEQFSFHAHDGRTLRTLKDLAEALDDMSDGTFAHHANREKNDFSSWIKDIMNYHDLAHNMLGKNRPETKRAIIAYLKKQSGRK
ncbi:MAG: hypothetical protein R6U32_04390 [Candidatus Woesearchaeota archaeon]